jgi:hypothetical protein
MKRLHAVKKDKRGFLDVQTLLAMAYVMKAMVTVLLRMPMREPQQRRERAHPDQARAFVSRILAAIYQILEITHVSDSLRHQQNPSNFQRVSNGIRTC